MGSNKNPKMETAGDAIQRIRAIVPEKKRREKLKEAIQRHGASLVANLNINNPDDAELMNTIIGHARDSSKLIKREVKVPLFKAIIAKATDPKQAASLLGIIEYEKDENRDLLLTAEEMLAVFETWMAKLRNDAAKTIIETEFKTELDATGAKRSERADLIKSKLKSITDAASWIDSKTQIDNMRFTSSLHDYLVKTTSHLVRAQHDDAGNVFESKKKLQIKEAIIEFLNNEKTFFESMQQLIQRIDANQLVSKDEKGKTEVLTEAQKKQLETHLKPYRILATENPFIHIEMPTDDNLLVVLKAINVAYENSFTARKDADKTAVTGLDHFLKFLTQKDCSIDFSVGLIGSYLIKPTQRAIQAKLTFETANENAVGLPTTSADREILVRDTRRMFDYAADHAQEIQDAQSAADLEKITTKEAVIEKLKEIQRLIAGGSIYYQEMQLLFANEKTREIIEKNKLLDSYCEVNRECVSAMADKLMAIDADYIKQIDVHEFLLGEKEVKPTLSGLSNYCTKLTNFVTNDIISKSTVTKSALAMEYWIRVADRCLNHPETPNLDTAMAIFGGLGASPSFRLTDTKAMLSDKAVEMLDSLNKSLMSQNQKNIRQLLEKNPTMVPFVGMYKSDMTFLLEHTANIKHKSYFPAWTKSYETLNQYRHRFLNSTRATKELTASEEKFKTVLLGSTYNENEAYKLSLKLEPRKEIEDNPLADSVELEDNEKLANLYKQFDAAAKPVANPSQPAQVSRFVFDEKDQAFADIIKAFDLQALQATVIPEEHIQQHPTQVDSPSENIIFFENYPEDIFENKKHSASGQSAVTEPPLNKVMALIYLAMHKPDFFDASKMDEPDSNNPADIKQYSQKLGMYENRIALANVFLSELDDIELRKFHDLTNTARKEGALKHWLPLATREHAAMLYFEKIICKIPITDKTDESIARNILENPIYFLSGKHIDYINGNVDKKRQEGLSLKIKKVIDSQFNNLFNLAIKSEDPQLVEHLFVSPIYKSIIPIEKEFLHTNYAILQEATSKELANLTAHIKLIPDQTEKQKRATFADQQIKLNIIKDILSRETPALKSLAIERWISIMARAVEIQDQLTRHTIHKTLTDLSLFADGKNHYQVADSYKKMFDSAAPANPMSPIEALAASNIKTDTAAPAQGTLALLKTPSSLKILSSNVHLAGHKNELSKNQPIPDSQLNDFLKIKAPILYDEAISACINGCVVVLHNEAITDKSKTIFATQSLEMLKQIKNRSIDIESLYKLIALFANLKKAESDAIFSQDIQTFATNNPKFHSSLLNPLMNIANLIEDKEIKKKGMMRTLLTKISAGGGSEAEPKQQEAAARKQVEAERKRVEAERKAREEAERKAREEAERKAREEVERKAHEEAKRGRQAAGAHSLFAHPAPALTPTQQLQNMLLTLNQIIGKLTVIKETLDETEKLTGIRPKL